jgi:hypothetical protein
VAAVPMAPFTVEQDLERACVRVWCETTEGQLRYRLEAEPEHLIIHVERGPQPDRSALPYLGDVRRVVGERLSLGSHRQLDWDRVVANGDPTQLLPVWMRLGQMTPASGLKMAALLRPVEEAIESRRPEGVIEPLRTAFRVGFAGLMVPHVGDPHGWGHATDETEPLSLLVGGMALIRQLFVTEGDQLSILPCLPPQLHCGRMTDVATSWGRMDLEWSKKSIRRMVLRMERPVEIAPQFQSGLKQFRLRCSEKDRGRVCSVGATLALNETVYWLDRFER